MITASILITCYNQARFVGQAVASALEQSAPPLEVIVVDDGSTDGSREVIAGLGDSVTAVAKENGGQASAINAGVAVARGDAIYFLDGDDFYARDVLAETMPLFEAGAAKVHWPYQPVDADGRPSGNRVEPRTLAAGDLRETVRRHGPGSHTYPPSSANAAWRSCLERVMPVPEQPFRTGADMYLSELMPFTGPIAVAPGALSFYRRHPAGDSRRMLGRERVERWVAWHHACVDAAAAYCRQQGIAVATADWQGHGWPVRLQQALREIERRLPPGASFVLIDDNAWGLAGELAGARPFSARDGAYWGPPVDDDAAIAELEECRSVGIRHVAVLWNAFWWRDHYARAFRWLADRAVVSELPGVLALYRFR